MTRHAPLNDRDSAPPSTDSADAPVTSAPREFRENFVPLRKSDLVSLLCHQPDVLPDEAADFKRLCSLLEATIHFEFQALLEELKNAYAPFDPDADTRSLWVMARSDRDQRARDLFDKLGTILARANFRRLSRADIEQAMHAMSDFGVNLHVDFKQFHQLEVHARGIEVDRRPRRNWRSLFRTQVVDVPVYRRLVVAFRIHEEHESTSDTESETIYLKVFKNIPTMDLDMLLPNSRLKMTVMGRSRVLLPIISGSALAVWKIVQAVAIMAYAGISLTVLALVGGSVGYGLRSFHSHLRTKQKYQLNLTRSLYYQNLDNNAGVLYRLLDEAEEQECREAILAWFFLWQRAGDRGWAAHELDRRIEEFLAQVAHIHCDFEIGDALAKLRRLGLIETTADEKLRAIPIAQALSVMDASWDRVFRYAGDNKSSQEPLA